MSWIFAALAIVVCASVAQAQVCTQPPRPPFAGHAFPLDSPPVIQSLTPVEAFPSLPAFASPLFLTYAPDGTNRLFVIEQEGRIRVFENSPTVSTTSVFLDLTTVVDDSAQEMGLLGLAFDPNFATNRFFYVNYTDSGTPCQAGSGLCTKIVRYTVPAGTPNDADETSAFQILEYAQPFDNHNGGMMAFGPDGMLWIAAGDGGSGGDPEGNGQNINAVLGKLLRIDPSGDAFPTDARRNYKIPAGNPYAGGGGAAEWWARGVRNPWRFSFDRLTGDLYVGDVGQNLWEEVSYIPSAERAAPPAGGFNLGWRVCEGTHDYGGNCATHASRKPQIEYPHNPQTGGYSVTGGYVYRGDRLPSLYGAYFYADFEVSRVWAWNGSLPANPPLVADAPNPSSFGEDRDGELYVTSFDGNIYEFNLTGPAPAQFPSALSATGLFSSTPALAPAAGLVEYAVNVPQWADRALLRRWVALPSGQKAHFRASGGFDFPLGTVLVQQLDLPTGPTTTRRVETRILLRQLERWAAFTYRWNTGQTDATLVTAPASEVINVYAGGSTTPQTWNYSPQSCAVCHSQPEQRVLGPRALQLNRSFSYPSGSDNQIHAWACLAMFDRDPQVASAYGAWAAIGDTGRTIAARARSYLGANCASCHQPSGPAPGNMDLRGTRTLAELNAIGVAPTEGGLGLPTPQRIRVGVPEQSVLWHRQQSTDAAIRMPDGSLVPDAAAVPVFDSWIRTGLATLDSDGDADVDSADNCPRTANASQADGGGFNTTTPDGFGDACQCGDANTDARFDAADLAPIRAALAQTGPALSGAANRRCVSPSDTGECSIVSWARMRKRLNGTVAAHGQTCPAAMELSF